MPKFKCLCGAKIIRDKKIPIQLDGETHFADGYHCPECKVMFFKGRAEGYKTVVISDDELIIEAIGDTK